MLVTRTTRTEQADNSVKQMYDTALRACIALSRLKVNGHGESQRLETKEVVNQVLFDAAENGEFLGEKAECRVLVALDIIALKGFIEFICACRTLLIVAPKMSNLFAELDALVGNQDFTSAIARYRKHTYYLRKRIAHKMRLTNVEFRTLLQDVRPSAAKSYVDQSTQTEFYINEGT